MILVLPTPAYPFISPRENASALPHRPARGVPRHSRGSSKASNYVVQVEFVDASGTRLGEASAAASNVAPEQEVNTKAQGLDQITTKVTCGSPT
ncbi:FxLYD domain-containing protein [Streptomyces sp. NPDC058629]|uniref:FxLYD domain-containing protein n=1 Tax=Streptomyces sp. NPDC058629 TaxID=3346565 RepID=UPI00364916AA